MRGLGHSVTHFVRRAPREAYRDRASYVRGVKGDVLLRNAVALDVSGIQLAFRRAIWKADVVHIFDISVAWGALFSLLVASLKPTVFRIPDFSGVTGGCLFPKGCRRFEAGCGECPQIGRWPLQLPIDLTRQHFALHEQIAQTPNTVAITPSQYMAKSARSGAWARGAIEVIPNAVDVDVFHPSRRTAGRARLGLEESARCLLFVAVNVLDARKGFRELMPVFRRLAAQNPRLRLAIVGNLPTLPKEYQDLRERLHLVGSVNDDSELAELYAAADLYVVPSLADTFNITLIEAMSCGTPVVAYPTGGMTEVFVHGESGWFTEAQNPTALEAALREALSRLGDSERRELCRLRAVEHYSLNVMCERHVDVYTKLLS